MRPLKKKVSITLDEDVIEKIRLFAEETDRSFSQYINLLLRKHISAREAVTNLCAMRMNMMCACDFSPCYLCCVA